VGVGCADMGAAPLCYLLVDTVSTSFEEQFCVFHEIAVNTERLVFCPELTGLPGAFSWIVLVLGCDYWLSLGALKSEL